MLASAPLGWCPSPPARGGVARSAGLCGSLLEGRGAYALPAARAASLVAALSRRKDSISDELSIVCPG